MNEIMAKRLDHLKKARAPPKKDQPKDIVEGKSGMLLKEGTRKLSDDQLIGQAGRRDYVALDLLDEPELTSSTKGFFTTGVVVNKTGVR